MQLLIQASPLIDKLKQWHRAISFNEVQLTTSQKVVLWSIGVVGTSAVVVGVLSRYLARRRAKPILNARIQRAINKRISRMRSPNGGMGSVASSGGRSSPLGFSERLSLASGSIGSGGGDAAPLSPQQLGVMGHSEYPLRPWLLTPIVNAQPGSPDVHSTNIHCLTRNTVERCIGVLKTCWRCLLAHRVLHYDHYTVGKIVNACAVLHNICNSYRLPIQQLQSVDSGQDHHQQIPTQVQDKGPADELQLLASGGHQRHRIEKRLWSARL